ncbi:MAG: hypothetical protein ACI9S8_000612 [Chlamydiales bacterium]|jgi:hypothetical protein
MIENKNGNLESLPDDIKVMTSFEFMSLPERVRFGDVNSSFHKASHIAILLEGREIVRFLNELNRHLPSAQRVAAWSIDNFQTKLSQMKGLDLLQAFTEMEKLAVSRVKWLVVEVDLDSKKYKSLVVERIFDALRAKNSPIHQMLPFPGVIGF